MAQRHVSLDLRKIADFLKTHKTSLAAGTVLVPASAIDGELAPEFKVELKLPFGLSTPPIRCQTIQRLPDGSVAAQIPSLPEKARLAFAAVVEGVAEVRCFLLESGELVEPGDAELTPGPSTARAVEAPPPAPKASPTESAALASQPEPEPSHPPTPAEPAPAEPAPAEPAPAEPTPASELAPQTEISEVDRSHSEGLLLPQDFGTTQASGEGQLGGRFLRQHVMGLGFTGATGILHIEMDDGTQRYGFWHRGGPVGWRRTPAEPNETLGGLLVRSKHITPEQLEQGLAQQAQTHERLGQILVAQGSLPAEQLGAVLSKQVEFVLQLALRAGQGTWRFVPTELGQGFPLQPVNVLAVLYGAMASHGRTLSPDRIFGVIRPQLNKRINLLPIAEGLIERAAWNADERVLLDVLQGSTLFVRNLFNQVDLPRSEVAVMLWALSELGVLSFGKGGEGLDKKRYLRQITGPIQDRLARVKEANPFDTFDLSWICAQAQVEQAYQVWQARFSSERFEVLTTELRADLGTIQESHEAAYQAISTQAQRRSLRAELVGSDAVAQAAQLLLQKAKSLNDAQKAAQARAKAADLVS